MIIGAMSDTHGNVNLMQRIADRMLDEFKVDAIVHLGDDLADARKLKTCSAKLYAVPGMYEDAWLDGSVPHRVIEDFGGVRFLLSHTPTKDGHDFPGDLNPELAASKYSCDVLLHGHTHIYRAVEAAGGLIIVNPGHAKSDEDRGRPATFAVIEAKRPDIKVEIYEASAGLVDLNSFVTGGGR